MIFSMNAQDLLEGLNTVTRALSARPAKQILEGVLISADDGREGRPFRQDGEQIVASRMLYDRCDTFVHRRKDTKDSRSSRE